MKRVVPFIFVIIMWSASIQASECDNACKQDVIEQYFNHLSEVYKKGSSLEDIDKLFSLFSDDVKYEHVEYHANFNMAEWQDAFSHNLKQGVYGASDNSTIKVNEYIFGKQHVAAEYSYGVINKSGSWQADGDQNLFILFGFTGRKLNLIREYW